MSIHQSIVKNSIWRPIRKLGLAAANYWSLPVKARLQNSRDIYVDLRSSIGRGIYMKGSFDPVVFQPFQDALKTGGVFIDVGANIGYYSMLALDLVGETGFVHAFEIDERPLRCFRKTIVGEKLRNLCLHEVAVGKIDGHAYLVCESDCGHSHVSTTEKGLKIPIITLDSWRERNCITNIQGIKLDIEGGEFAALQGARKLLEEERPLVVCEVFENYKNRTNRDSDELFQFFTDLDYKVNVLEGGWSPGLIATP